MRRPSRRGVAAGLLVGAGLGAVAARAESGAVHQEGAYLVVSVRAPFDEVLVLLQEAIKRRNYAVTGVNNLDDTLARRAADVAGPAPPYERYKIVGFCNLSLADAVLRDDPLVGALMPCRAVVFKRQGAPETVVAALRPRALAAALGTRGLDAVLEQLEADVVAILDDIAGD
jgi:uncharacterized protein (DUF302 family)